MADRLESKMEGLLVSEVAQRRLDRIASHLCDSSLVQEEQLSRELCAKLIKRPVNPSVLANLMAGMSSFSLINMSVSIIRNANLFTAIDSVVLLGSPRVYLYRAFYFLLQSSQCFLRCRFKYLCPSSQF